MTLPFKAVAVDMDGTFLDDRKQFNHKEFDQILTEFEQRGVHFIVASGRPYEGQPWPPEPSGLRRLPEHR